MNTTTQWPEAISEKKRNLIIQLIYKIADDEERERWLNEVESATTENDADEMVKSLLR